MGKTSASYLSGDALGAGADQVGGVGQVDEQFLLGLQSWSWKIQEENLRRGRRWSEG